VVEIFAADLTPLMTFFLDFVITEILSDPKKREIYDKYGLEGVEQEGGPSAAGGEDLFSMFFGGGRGRSAGPRKGPSLNHPLKVSLEDLYNGKTVKLAINRKVLVGDSSECSRCDGHGVVMEMRQIGPGMITQMQRPCSECNGQGYKAQTKNERKVIEVHVEKGAHHNQKITFKGMADEVPGRETGDVNFVIQEKDHELFKRKGADLLIMQDVSLNQALTGFSVCIRSCFLFCVLRYLASFFSHFSAYDFIFLASN
jgi:DnaJ homolog subfamily A member 2